MYRSTCVHFIQFTYHDIEPPEELAEEGSHQETIQIRHFWCCSTKW